MERGTNGRPGALIERLDAAVRLGDVRRVTSAIKRTLESMCADEEIALPPRYCAPGAQSYARRLLHRSPELDYTVVVMAWGPGQGTRLHDHAGIWCVECVVQGQIEVTRYDLVARAGARFEFERRERVRAGVGDAGSLIPPFEYHVLANALPDRTSISLHVYGGEMDRCNLYEPSDDGSYRAVARALTYDA